MLRSQQSFKSERRNVFTEIVNKIALSSNYDQRLQSSDRNASYPYDANPGKVSKKELLQYRNIK